MNYPSSSGYEYSPNDKGYDALCGQAVNQTTPHEASIKWVLEEFGRESASRLELISTIVFAEREMRRKKQAPLKTELCRRVKRIKPHFTDATIVGTVDELSSKGLISTTSA